MVQFAPTTTTCSAVETALSQKPFVQNILTGYLENISDNMVRSYTKSFHIFFRQIIENFSFALSKNLYLTLSDVSLRFCRIFSSTINSADKFVEKFSRSNRTCRNKFRNTPHQSSSLAGLLPHRSSYQGPAEEHHTCVLCYLRSP